MSATLVGPAPRGAAPAMLRPMQPSTDATRRARPGTLHVGNLRTRAARLVLRALARRAASCVRIEDLDPQRSRREHAASALADLARIGIDWDGETVPPERAPRAPPRGVRAAARRAGSSTPAGARAPRSALASQAPHGAAEAPTRAPAAGCRRASASASAAAIARARGASTRGGARIRFEDDARRHVSAHVDDFVVWRGDGVPGVQPRGRRRRRRPGRRRGRPRRRPARDDAAPDPRSRSCSAWRSPLRARPARARPDGARLAKRHGAVTLDARLAGGWTRPADSSAGWPRAPASAPEGAAMDARQVLAAFAPERLVAQPRACGRPLSRGRSRPR